ncbi:MAG: ATP-binding cassette domain-containing protein [Alphaproteobacteria bacterium]
MARQLLILEDISLTFGGHPVLSGVDLTVHSGDRICLVGRNGSGKSTLLKIAAGMVEPDSGSRWTHPGTTIRYLAQEPDLSTYSRIGDYVEDGMDATASTHRVADFLDKLHLDPDGDPKTLSGGEARKAALARVLLAEPDVLFLDEPTNHLDIATIEWLEQTLRGLKSAIVLISHDRRFLTNLSRATVWLDRGTARRQKQGFASFEEWRDQVLDEEATTRHKLDRKIAMEEDWLRYGVTARRKRNQKRLADLHALRAARRNYRGPQGKATLTASEAGQSGKRVLEVEDLSKSFGDRAIVRDLSIRVLRGDRLALIGPNGAGKTTLINLLTGKLAPDAGRIDLGTALEIASLDQKRASLSDDTSLQDALTGGRGDTVTVNGKERHVVGYMKDFLFTPNQARQPIGKLSGGERGRLMLARALSLPSNVLILDEPTNDLDLETLDLLQEMLDGYPGTVLFVSHDRDFLDRVATSVLVAEGDGHWSEYPGGYSDMMDQRGAAPTRANADAGKPKPQKPKPRPAPKTATPALSAREQELLRTLPGQIDGLRAQKEKLEAAMAAPGFYNGDRDSVERTSRALQKIVDTLALAEDRWLELEIKRETLS